MYWEFGKTHGFILKTWKVGNLNKNIKNRKKHTSVHGIFTQVIRPSLRIRPTYHHCECALRPQPLVLKAGHDSK